ncbi:unnamed protein product [Linum trigynum]|uniref:Uncharacterized protein n=1 Tax=Linum trigynum TaxID=586398 RepID=A0AAV2EQH1_9ROSI
MVSCPFPLSQLPHFSVFFISKNSTSIILHLKTVLRKTFLLTFELGSLLSIRVLSDNTENLAEEYPERQRSSELQSSSEEPCRNTNPDLDFNDVFGWPSRQKAQHSFGMEPFENYPETALLRTRWSWLYEKPIFGEHQGAKNREGRIQN